jgi:hypothetical protein
VGGVGRKRDAAALTAEYGRQGPVRIQAGKLTRLCINL